MTEAPKGHVKLARKAFDSDPWWTEPREFSRWEAWVDVIQLAAYRAGRFHTDFGVIELARGEFVASLRWLAARWHWTVKRVRNWLATAQKWARLRAQHETAAGTVYLIVNYDTYQRQGHSKSATDEPPKGTAGAQQGHKIEAGKASKAVTTLSDSPDVIRVLDHYLGTHSRRRVSVKDAKVVAAALALGYSSAELCEAIDGNAADEWHREKGKHELSYVLRNTGKIDDFRAKAEASTPRAAVDPATGLLNDVGMAVVLGGRR